MSLTKQFSIATIRTVTISIGTVGTTIWLFASSLASQSQAASFSASADIIGDPEVERMATTEPDSLVSASTVGVFGEAVASASAGSDFSLRTFASSNNIGIQTAQGVAGIVSDYTIVGGSDISYPLSFNYKLTGSLSTSTAPRNSFSIASAGFSSSTSVGNDNTSGAVSLTSQAGIPLITTSGSFGEGNLSAIVTPTVSIGAEIVQLGNEDLQFLFGELETENEALQLLLDGLQPELEISVEALQEEVSVIEGLIASQLFNVGLPTQGLLPGVEAEIGFDADFIFETNFSQPVLTSISGGTFFYDLSSTALATVSDASAVSDYSATLTLESITVPTNFNAVDISGLSVLFDSGLTIPVTRENVIRPEPIPEPSTMLGVLVTGTLGAYSLLKRKLKEKFGSNSLH